MADAKRKTWMSKGRAAGQAFCLLLPVAGQQQMGQQPSYRPLEPSTFFPDDRSARPLLPGTVAQGQFQDDQTLFKGKDGNGRGASLAVSLIGFGAHGPLIGATVVPPLSEKMAVADYTDTFPFPVTEEVMARGQQRFTIFCAVCHDPTGTGHRTIVPPG